MANAGSCNTGLISAPLDGAKGRIVSKGFDVISKKDRNPTKIKEIIPTLIGFKTSSLSTLALNK